VREPARLDGGGWRRKTGLVEAVRWSGGMREGSELRTREMRYIKETIFFRIRFLEKKLFYLHFAFADARRACINTAIALVTFLNRLGLR